jgi:hypothetical protein
MTELQNKMAQLLLDHARTVEIDFMKDGVYDDYFEELPTKEDYEVVIKKLTEFIRELENEDA